MFSCSKVPFKDKGCHAIAGFIITLGVALVFNVALGFIAGFAAGVAKEAYDEYTYDGAEFYDLLATMVGVFAAVMTYGFINYFLKG